MSSKKNIPTWFRQELPLLLFLMFQLISVSADAQFTKLLDFGNKPNGTHPYSTLISDGTFLYGTASEGGLNDQGTIYKIKPDGTGFVKLIDFDGTNGSNPYGALLFDGTFLYGTTHSGGTNGDGTIFKVMPDGTGFVKLFDFAYTASGAFPFGSLISDGTYLYGTSSQGGANNGGTLFKIKPDGTDFTKLLEFNGTTNGSNPYGSLLSDGTFLYGMTSGGFSDLGSIFKIKPDGTGYAKLLDFSGTATGSNPFGSLISDGTFLYGMTFKGGSNGYGTLFKIKPDATGFAKLLDFDNTGKGGSPKGSLIYDGTFLYGMTSDFGPNYGGTIFKIKTDGTGFVKLLDNDVGTGGPSPEGTLLSDGTSLYGVRSGVGIGPGYQGIIFKINPDGTGYSKLLNYETSGNSPSGSLFSDGTFQYGMTYAGGLTNYGTIFKIKPDGTGFAKLFDFEGTTGRRPYGSLISDGTFLYGMTSQGGTNDEGVIFKILPDGTGYVKLLDFDDATNGAYPSGSLIYDGTFLYGMTAHGGPDNYGVIFKIKPDGSNYQKLLELDYTNNGAYPNADLLSDGTFLCGATYQGGLNGEGTLFKIKPDGTGFTKLLDFDYTINGSNPYGSLISDGTFLYGMTNSGGSGASHIDGTIFKIKPDGTSYANLLDFDGSKTGSNPYGSLLSDGTFLYGMTSSGGIAGLGTIFKIKSDGTGFAKLLDFNDGSYAQGSLISDGTFLYGMTQNGGENGLGTLFKTTMTSFVGIANFTPGYGVVGTYVTIEGTDFDPIPANNTVTFNNTPAKVTSATVTTLTVIVPVGATTGPIAVTASTTAMSVSDFDVTAKSDMFNGTVQNCDVPFIFSSSPDNLTETFLPVNPADKVKVSFSSFLVDDLLKVYDGPDTSSPLIASLKGNDLPNDLVATGPGGELTFEYVWEDEGSSWDAMITCQASHTTPPVIATIPLNTSIGGKITLNLIPLITLTNTTLDLTSLSVVVPPSSGATASIDTAGILTIDYTNKDFSGADRITIKACDANGNCTTQLFNIDVAGDIVVYNGISPNGTNPSFIIEHIETLPDTKKNTVYIFDRWENQVWHGTNYDNTSVVFTGVSDGGADLPTGVYYYKIDFASGRKNLTGFLSLRRK